MLTRRMVLAAPLALCTSPARAATWQDRLVSAAEAQIGRTVIYDPSYVRIAYPGGDVPDERGVCTDVVIRAYREGLSFDLQKAVHEDMAANFGAYPKHWGLKRTDRNIDHRRVPNLQAFFRRKNAKVMGGGYQAGDLVTMMLPSNLPHIVVVSAASGEDADRPLVIHNIGAGTRREAVLDRFPITGHYRFNPD